MRIFVSEYICGGAGPAEAGSLADEGRAMLLALLDDFARISDVTIDTTWDQRLVWPAEYGLAPGGNVSIWKVGSAEEERDAFRELAHECDGTCVIAPEFNGILAERCRKVIAVGGRLLGPNVDAVELCADKLQFARHLTTTGIPTIETHLLFLGGRDADDLRFPAVVKPRDGAGSQATYLIHDRREFDQLLPLLMGEPLLQRAIWQPYIAGRTMSVAIIVGEDRRTDVFPPGEQILSDNGRFQYLGGILPAANCDIVAIQRIASAAAETIPGLRGYVGLDLIVPEGRSNIPLIVEFNPRLTTSYLGYRRLARENLAERMLSRGLPLPLLSWQSGPVSFTPQTISLRSHGQICRSSASSIPRDVVR